MSKIESDSEWILPNNLKAVEGREKNKGISEVDVKSDFGSYRMLLAGAKTEDSLIGQHNCIGIRAQVYSQILVATVKIPSTRSFALADVGCGAGFVTAAIHERYPKAQIHGFDIAEDAIAYANKAFAPIEFFVQPINGNEPLKQKYDLVHAMEFYPFTRTNSLEIHLSYINGLANSLRPGGTLVITAANTEKCINNNLSEIQNQLSSTLDIQIVQQPSYQIFRYIPVLPLANMLTAIVNKILGRPGSRIWLIKNK